MSDVRTRLSETQFSVREFQDAIKAVKNAKFAMARTGNFFDRNLLIEADNSLFGLEKIVKKLEERELNLLREVAKELTTPAVPDTISV